MCCCWTELIHPLKPIWVLIVQRRMKKLFTPIMMLVSAEELQGWQTPGIVEGATDRPTVTIRDACVLVKVTRRTIYNWMAKGKVQYRRTASGSVRIFTDTLWR